MTYADCVTLIRDRLQADSVETLSNEAIARTFDSVYIQWWSLFSRRIVNMTTPAMGSGFVTVTQPAGFADIVSVHEIIGGLGYELVRRPLSEVRWLVNNRSKAAGGAQTGLPAEMYAVEITQSTALIGGTAATPARWTIYTFPQTTSTLSIKYRLTPGRVSTEIPDPDPTTGSIFECDDATQIGLCAISAMRLMPAVGKHNDQGLIQALVSEIPQEMQSMVFAAKYSDVSSAPTVLKGE